MHIINSIQSYVIKQTASNQEATTHNQVVKDDSTSTSNQANEVVIYINNICINSKAIFLENALAPFFKE